MTEMKIQPCKILVTLFLLFPAITYADMEISDNVEITCKQSITDKILRCDYRLIKPEPVLSITAKYRDKTVPLKNQENYPWNNAITAILLLVDTSDPARENVIRKNYTHIKQILNASKKYHRIGLASFDKSLKLEVPIGLSNEQIINAAEKLRATGQTTELYRSTLTAIELLDKIKADRKSIYIFSDGLAEDTAYFHEDVVRAARKSGVVITSFGYPRSVSQSVALQTLRRLSEETGGLFIEADNNFNISDNILNHPFDSIDDGGKFTVDLSTLSLAGNDNNTLSLDFETDTGDYTKTVPLSFITVKTLPENTKPEQKQAPAIQTNNQNAPAPITVITRETPQESENLWFWYGIPIFLVILLIITVITLVLVTFKQNKKQGAKLQSITDFKPYAYLVVQDETKKRYSITRTTWRIGRGKDNEMILDDSSVSRRHAEIHRDKGDRFMIYDLGSLNGVYVNNNKISSHRLHEGDIIEIGDINLRFTLLSTEYSLEEATEMQNTRAPVTH